MENKRILFHIDVNSAYLSWTAVKQLQYGENIIDIRNIPSIVGGSSEDRHGIVLAKSIPAKEFKIKTGETVASAISKCSTLKIYPPDYKLYMKCSNAMYQLLSEYSPLIQRYSIDEVFMDASHFKKNYMDKAYEIKDRIQKELGFTVNIGISYNKLLAKMASDFTKKNEVHTLFKEEIKEKMWNLQVGDLFMVGRATEAKLIKLNINTIGELAAYDLEILKSIFKSYANVLHNYANGIDYSEVRQKNYIEVKGIGNSTTLRKDVTSRKDALMVILSLTESVAMRLRANGSMCGLVAVSLKSNSFYHYSHQKHLINVTDCTNEIYKAMVETFDEMWRGEPIRHIGVRVSKLCSNDFYQRTLFDDEMIEKQRALDKTIDELRERFGDGAIVRSTFINSEVKPVTGGVGESDYPMMGSIL